MPKGQKLLVNKGDRFGMLVVIKENELLRLPSGQINRNFTCACDCGKESIVRLVHLIRGRITSCGCLLGEKHDPKYNGIYNTWRGMKSRCKSKRPATYRNYGAKGIYVFEEWKNSFLSFLSWALDNGWDNGLEIDRIDSDKSYYPSNCRFVDQIGQSNNIKTNVIVVYKGNKYTLRNLARELKKTTDIATIYHRIKRGWAIERAFDTPIKVGNYKRSGKKW